MKQMLLKLGVFLLLGGTVNGCDVHAHADAEVMGPVIVYRLLAQP